MCSPCKKIEIYNCSTDSDDFEISENSKGKAEKFV